MMCVLIQDACAGAIAQPPAQKTIAHHQIIENAALERKSKVRILATREMPGDSHQAASDSPC
jgi:hypothetical protein